MKKCNIGILLHVDPTRKGAITSEIKFIKSLYEQNKKECKFYIITLNENTTKRVIKQRDNVYNFPHDIVKVYDDSQLSKLKDFSGVLTYPLASNFYAGIIAKQQILAYKCISYLTNNHVPIFMRVNDSEIKVRDHKKLIMNRVDKCKPDNKFINNLQNIPLIRDIERVETVNYHYMYWFANGSAETYDWVHETLYSREHIDLRCASEELIKQNTIYVSDDIFFLIRSNFRRFLSGLSAQHNSRLLYIGFFDTVNTGRASVFKKLFKQNKCDIPLTIFGKGTKSLDKLKQHDNIDIVEGFIKGDSDEYFKYLNEHLAYIFIGKGKGQARYIGKTVYDAMVARIPILVYKPADPNGITFSDQKYYFETEAELKSIILKLQNTQLRSQWIYDQSIEIFSKLPKAEFNFTKYCRSNNKIESIAQLNVLF